jgi:hypothetical protein
VFTAKRDVRPVAAGALPGAASATGAASPRPLTPAQITFLNDVCGDSPGCDDQPLLAGLQPCRQLYTGRLTLAVVGAAATQDECGR